MNLGLLLELRNRMQNNMVDEIINTDKENLLEDTTFIVDIDDKNTELTSIFLMNWQMYHVQEYRSLLKII